MAFCLTVKWNYEWPSFAVASVAPSGRRGRERALAWGRSHVGLTPGRSPEDRNLCGTKLRPDAKRLRHCDEKTKTDTIWAGWADKKSGQRRRRGEFPNCLAELRISPNAQVVRAVRKEIAAI
jgi:hypothetical protein